jgi:imidazoleglycerol-phosphate dehydratase
MIRKANWQRSTTETSISAEVVLEGKGTCHVHTPIGLLTHMLQVFARSGCFDLDLEAEGDLHVDQHHLVEDSGMVLGSVFDMALGDRRGINRAGFFVYPMDEALAVVAVDIAGRPFLQYEASFSRRFCGDFDTDLFRDFLQALAVQLRANVVVRMPYGRSDHHKLESAFKALGKAMRMACSLDIRDIQDVSSTKGVIDDHRDR